MIHIFDTSNFQKTSVAFAGGKFDNMVSFLFPNVSQVVSASISLTEWLEPGVLRL